MREIKDKRWDKLLELLAVIGNISGIYSERLGKVFAELEKEVKKAEKTKAQKEGM